MLRVSYLKTYGYMIIKRSDGQGTFKSLFHPANALYGLIYHDRKNKLAHLINFAVDIKHLKRCLKDEIFLEDTVKIVIYTNTDWKERFKVAELFQKFNYPIEMKYAKRWKRCQR